jgi:hypothetical protein
VTFVFGMDARVPLQIKADELPDEAWKKLRRPARYTVKTKRRCKRSKPTANRGDRVAYSTSECDIESTYKENRNDSIDFPLVPGEPVRGTITELAPLRRELACRVRSTRLHQ